ncbi:MAG TPA: hypothetical protein VEH84_15570 [Alphaproteobacteria bacterium]|nr:hypothetical protein [Alphaproteobacteria bacterium]
MDSNRLEELRQQILKMGVATTVFATRIDRVGDPAFRLFVELLELYIARAQAAVARRHDFIAGGLPLGQAEEEQIRSLCDRIFRRADLPPEPPAAAPAAPERRK